MEQQEDKLSAPMLTEDEAKKRRDYQAFMNVVNLNKIY